MRKYNKHLVFIFVDFHQVFDTVAFLSILKETEIHLNATTNVQLHIMLQHLQL